MPTYSVSSDQISILKELYSDHQYYDVVGAKEEIIKRINMLPKVQRMLLGIEEDVSINQLEEMLDD